MNNGDRMGKTRLEHKDMSTWDRKGLFHMVSANTIICHVRLANKPKFVQLLSSCFVDSVHWTVERPCKTLFSVRHSSDGQFDLHFFVYFLDNRNILLFAISKADPLSPHDPALFFEILTEESADETILSNRLDNQTSSPDASMQLHHKRLDF